MPGRVRLMSLGHGWVKKLNICIFERSGAEKDYNELKWIKAAIRRCINISKGYDGTKGWRKRGKMKPRR